MNRNQGIVIFPILVLVVIILLGLFMTFNGSGNIFQKNQHSSSTSKQDLQDQNKMSLKGMVWTTGLTDQEKLTLNIDSNYQLVKSMPKENWPIKISGYYLLSENVDFSEHLGHCVSIIGETQSGWENLDNSNYKINGKWTYNRSALVIRKINKIDIKECIDDFDRTIKDKEVKEHLEYITANGTLTHAKRPAPDISYDLLLMLNKPRIDEQNATGKPQSTDRLDVSAGTDEIFIEILNNIGNKVEIGGYMEWGHAESRFLRVDRLRIL